MEEKKTDQSTIMYDLKTAKAKSGLSYHILRAMALSGEIPAVRIGGKRGKIMINGQKLEEYLACSRLTD
ncbi:MAG: hypothetical protein IJ784_01360 [Ruminiclostridium sp.]|uniref:hypothetical protein n=1 Tax=Ruminococcus sp. TaxID=41978 RepID=UPI0025FA78B6|nr:hypothetical protein [Ruminococcus sp.]MBR1433029.1 hypothetical protein [Ruminococcus sp.]MBR1831064.1 hypothetical protein [Ruminiclostridium sp.]